MKESKEEKRTRLLEKAAEAIDEYLEWEEQNPRTPAPGPRCSQCGEEMRYKGKKRTRVESRTGDLEVERGYYYCPKCKQRIFPPGSAAKAE